MPARSSSPKRATRLDRAAPPSRRATPVVPLRKASAALVAATPLAIDLATGQVCLRVAGSELPGRLGPGVDAGVIASAVERRETVVAADDGGWVVLGALRTQPTPGIDKADEYVIEANRVELRGADRVAIVSGAAEILVQAIDRVEIMAADITSRARRVHRLVGRMLHLN